MENPYNPDNQINYTTTPNAQSTPYSQQAPTAQNSPYPQQTPGMQYNPYQQNPQCQQNPQYQQYPQGMPCNPNMQEPYAYRPQPLPPFSVTNPMENKRANILCIISLVCAVVPFLISLVMAMMSDSYITATTIENYAMVAVISRIVSILNMLSSIAALVLMIVARAKYPRNVFAKVLMWVYIALIILAVVLFAIVMISFAIACNSCVESLEGCGCIL